MYPRLKECLVRGAGDEFFLQNYATGEDWALDDKLQAEILHACDGGLGLMEIAQKTEQFHEDVLSFLRVFQENDLLEFLQNPEAVKFPALQKDPAIQDIQLEVTSKCNLRCLHCYGRREFFKIEKEEISTERVIELIGQMRDLNVALLTLSGGETFLRKDLPEIIRCIANHRIRLNGIFTNATLYRQEVIDAIKDSAIKPTLLVSLDGHDSASHDYIRGDGNFDKSIAFIKKVISQGLRVTVNTVVMKNNVFHLEEMRNFLRDLGVSRWRISIPREQGEAIVNSDQIMPDLQDIFSAYKRLLIKTIENPKGMRIQLSSIFKSEFLDTGQYTLFCDKTSCCQYKRWSLTVSSNGNVLTCPSTFQTPLGNILETNLSDIWYSNLVQAFKSIPLCQTECADCEIRAYCGGGCRMMARSKTGNLFGRDENACPLYHFFFKEILPIFESVGIKGVTLKESECAYDTSILNSV